jgi:sensor histidine kinase YesM
LGLYYSAGKWRANPVKISERLKPVNFVWATLWGLAIGVAVGYVATRCAWGFGYVVAIGMILGCANAIWAFQVLTENYIYPKFERFSRGKRLACQLLSSFLAHIIGWLIPVLITGLFIGFSLFRKEVLLSLGIFVICTVIVRSIKLLISFYRELAKREVMEEKLRTLAAQAELKALKAQINPHFLFNSLNTIASLISTDSQKAESSVERLADIFRYTLSASDKEFVTLRDELEFIDSYLEIEKARFGDRLKVTMDISPEIVDTPIPSLILQPLVENSIKHGFATSGEMRMGIAGYMDGDLVKVEIKDEGRGMPKAIRAGTHTGGTGIRNVSERLKKVYGDGYGLEFKQNKPGGTVVVVAIPKEKK